MPGAWRRGGQHRTSVPIVVASSNNLDACQIRAARRRTLTADVSRKSIDMSTPGPITSLPRCALSPILFATAVLCSGHVQAEQGDVIRPYIGFLVAHDDNLFHLNSPEQGQQTIGSTSLADTYRRMSAGVDIDKMVSQQRVVASLNLSRTQFNHYRQLDSDGKDLSAKLLWHVGPHIDGTVGTSYVESLTPFTEFRTQERNLRTQRHDFVDAGWRFHPSGRVRASVSRDRLDYALDSQRANDRNLTAEELGLDYLAADANIVGIQLGHSTGAYRFTELIGPVAVANDYSQSEIKGKVDWIFSGKTRVQFLGGWVERKHQAFTERDYRGFNGRLIGTLQVTSKTGLVGNLWHEIGAVDDLTASYSVNNGVSLDANYSATAKIQVTSSWRLEQRRFSGTAALPILQLSVRRSNYRYVSLGATYLPTRNWQIAAVGYHDQDASNIDALSYHANGVTMNARYEF